MSNLPLSVRWTAAACHLAAFTGLGAVLVPWLIGRSSDPSDDFTISHSRGAVHYQIGGIVVFSLAYLLRGIPARVLGLGEVWTEAALGLFWVIYLCAVTLYLCGLFALAAQALSGSEFDFMGYRPES